MQQLSEQMDCMSLRAERGVLEGITVLYSHAALHAVGHIRAISTANEQRV